MSYYILPKTNNKINIKLITDTVSSNVMLSSSLYNYYNEIVALILHTCSTDSSYNTFDDVIKITNTHEYIFSNVPGSQFPVSKYKYNTNLFYDFIEIINTLSVFYKTGPIKTLHISPNYTDTIECVGFTRPGCTQDQNFYSEHNNSDFYDRMKTTKFDFMFLETQPGVVDNLNDYSLELVRFVMLILNNQSEDGSCIIKIDHVFHKPVMDILYILSSLYDKIYVIKPSTSNIATFEKYIVCKNFLFGCKKGEHNKQMCNELFKITKLGLAVDCNILSFVDTEIPAYFCNKMDDINIIIGQQQLESLDQTINILKNRNRDDKIEMIKKSNVSKSIQWCEKFKISHHKFTDKVNMFLPLETPASVKRMTLT